MEMNNKKISIIILSVISMLIILGDIGYKPKLINAEKPFIELSGSVGNSIGNAQNAYALANPAPVAPTTPSVTNYDYRINIRMEEITLNGEPYSLNDLESDIKNGKFRGKTILLYDDYAETITFKSILSVLKSNNIVPTIDGKDWL